MAVIAKRRRGGATLDPHRARCRRRSSRRWPLPGDVQLGTDQQPIWVVAVRVGQHNQPSEPYLANLLHLVLIEPALQCPCRQPIVHLVRQRLVELLGNGAVERPGSPIAPGSLCIGRIKVSRRGEVCLEQPWIQVTGTSSLASSLTKRAADVPRPVLPNKNAVLVSSRLVSFIVLSLYQSGVWCVCGMRATHHTMVRFVFFG